MHAWRTQWLAGARAPSVRPHVPQCAGAGALRGRCGNFRTEPSAAAQASRRSRTAARARRFPTASTSPFSSGPSRRRSPTPRRARARGGGSLHAVCCIVRAACCLVARLLAACCMLPASAAGVPCRLELLSPRRSCGRRGRCTCRPQRACSAHSAGSASAFSPTAPARGTHTHTRAPRRTRSGAYTHGRTHTDAHAHTHARGKAVCWPARLGRPTCSVRTRPLVGCAGTRSSRSTSTRSRARVG